MHHHLQLVGRYEHGDRHVRSRQGTFLLFIVGIAAVLALLSAGFFAFSTGTRMAVGSMQAALYARQAAQVAVAQATYLIVSDLESSGTMPTHLDQDWRTKWLPDGAIGYAVGQEENDAKFTRPYGLEGFGVYNTVDKISIPIEAKDDIRWFTPVADSLTQFYCRVTYYRIGSYDYRSGIYYKGYLMTPGVGKYYPNFENNEGVYSYTNAPLNPDGTTVAAIWLDHRFRAVESYDRARYLVRYTANVEDLSGHLLSACTDATGNYIAGTAAKYALAAYTMGKFMERQPTAEAFRRIWMREPVAFYLDSGFWFDDYKDPEYKSKTNEPTIAKQTSPGELVQSWDVFRQIENPDAVGSEVPFGSYVLTPFGAITKKTDSPTKWYEGRTDCPWRLNLPTASAKAIMLVLMGALPAEFHQQLPMQSSGHWPWPRLVRDVPRNFKYDENSEDVALGEWNKYKHDHPSIDPTSAYVTELLDFTGGKYPGAGTWPSWSTELGKDIPLNKREMDYFGFPWQKPCPGRMPMSPLAGQWLAPYQPLWWYIKENKLYEEPFDLSYGFHFTSHRKSEDWNPGDDGYLYENSFYMDLAQAFINTIAYVQHRWMERLLSAKTAVEKPRLTAPPSDCATIKDVDRLFLQWFGVDLDNPPGTSATAKFATKLGNTTVWMHSYEPHAGQWLGRSETSVEMWQNYSATNHIKAMKDNGKTEEAKAMERVLNDFRMSVFGASPQYPDFKFLDMDGDGKAYASDSSAEPTSAAQRDPARYWSLSGYFVFQKSRYYRVFARGEVFDLYRRIPISQADYEVVVAVDWRGDKWDVNNNDLLPGIKPETRNLYQRWHDNRYTMNRPRLTFEATTAP